MPEPTPEKKDDGNLPSETMEVLKQIKEKLESPPKIEKSETPAPAPVVPTAADQRESLRKSLGYTEEQMAAHEELIMRSQAPIIERTGWQAIENRTDFKDLKKEIDEEVKFYPPERRTPEMMEKIYYYVRGRHADSKPQTKTPATPPTTRVSSGPGYTGTEPNLGSRDTGGEGEEDKLSEVESFVAKKLGVSEKDYARARKVGRDAWRLKPEDSRQSVSLADMELKRLTSR